MQNDTKVLLHWFKNCERTKRFQIVTPYDIMLTKIKNTLTFGLMALRNNGPSD